MEPLPETRHLVDEFGPFGVSADQDLLDTLTSSSERVRALVPSCVGISLAVLAEDLTFTLVATSQEIAQLDAVQYLDGGPCVDGAKADDVVVFESGDALSEQRWSMFARATAAVGVASTLTLPIMEGGRPVGSVNLYSSQPGAFDELHDEIGDIFGAWAPGAVADADLSFETREAARRSLDTAQERVTISRALGVLVAARSIELDAARAWLHRAAVRAGVTDVAFAQMVLEALDPGLD